MNARKKITYIVRWILLLPVSFGTGLLISMFLGVFLSYVINEPNLSLVKHASNSLIIPFFSVILVPIIAPLYKSRVIILTCGLWLTALLLCYVIVIAEIELYGQQYEVKDGGIATLMVLVGLASGYYLTRRSQTFRDKVLTVN
jgi:tellurite resistance protein TehA-like permease